ncbi:TonB-dependent siderophore receptor [Pseudomonas sp. 18175]|uniref:TonB-dependent siderophore receptor n=1 Tax=Pseudomonas sp. 18175 TaxID=3390056 RepID=UPI003D1FA92F
MTFTPHPIRPLKALSLAVALAAIVPLHCAQAAEAASTSAARSYNLAPGPLGNVLAQFAALSGVPLSFDSKLLNDQQSPGLQGSYTAQSGFMQLLQGSGYTLQSTGASGYTVVPQANGDAVELGATTISGESGAQADTYGGGQVARSARLGVLGSRSINDVPFSVVSYTAKTIADQQARTVGDVLLNDASVRQSSGFGNFSQVFTIRGLPLNTDDIAFNGLYGVLPRQIITTEALERVELFKGPNAFVNGVPPAGSGIGGSVNLVPKRAEDVATRSVTLDAASGGQTGGHLDLGQRFGEDNRFGARVNLAKHGGDTAIDDEFKSSQLIAVALDYRGDRLRVSTDFGYQKERINNGRSVVYPNGTQVPKAPSAKHNYAQDWSWSELEDTYGMFNAEYDLNESWTAYVGGGAKHTRENGEYSSLYVGNNGAGRVGFLYSPHDEDNKSAMAGLNGHFNTGPVTHQMNVGLSGIWGEQRSAFEAILQANRQPGNLYNPIQIPRPSVTYFGSDIHDPRVVGKNRIKSAAVSDTLGFIDDRVLLTLGVRRQTIEVDAWNTTTGVRNANYAESITTPVYGLVIKPWEHVSFYANRIEGLAQGPTVPTAADITNSGDVFPPNRSKQTEAGVKLDWDNVGATLGVYRIEQPNSATNNNPNSVTPQFPNGTRTFNVDGKQINKGVELNVFGEPVDGLRLLAGATLMRTELKNTSNGATDGNRAAGVPRYQFNVGADWDIPGLQGAAVSARMLRTGAEYVNATNTLDIPAWTRVDLGARYGFKADDKYITLRANVENVANKAYWASASTANNYLTQGEPRTVKVSATVDF